MIEPRPSVVRFARAIVRAETANGGVRGYEGAQRALARLHQQLGKLIGPVGFDVLVARSLVVARRAHPKLCGIGTGRGGVLLGLDAVPAEDAEELDEAATAVVAQLMELLVSLIGVDLAMTLLRDVWPTAAEPEIE